MGGFADWPVPVQKGSISVVTVPKKNGERIDVKTTVDHQFSYQEKSPQVTTGNHAIVFRSSEVVQVSGAGHSLIFIV